MSTSTLLRVASGSERLLAFRICVEAAFTKDGTNYHTLALLRRRMKPDGVTLMTYGEPVGSPYALNARSLPATTPVTLYANAPGLSLSKGDRIYLSLTQTGSPTALNRLTWELDIQAVTR